MTKLEFILALRDRLSDFPQAEVEERLGFYSEMIEDRMEEGLPEAEAVAAVGSVDEIAAQIASEIPALKTQKQPEKKGKVWKTVLLIVGSPIWASLLIAAAAVVFALYVCLWAIVVCLWAAFVAVAACVLGCIAAGVVFACCGERLSGLAMTGAGLVCAGLSIFLFYGCKAFTKGTIWLTKRFSLWIKKCFSKGEDTQ